MKVAGRVVGLGALVLGIAGCGAGAMPEAAAPPRRGTPAADGFPESAPAPEGFAGSAPAPAAPPAAAAAPGAVESSPPPPPARDEEAPSASQRPGLGTEWGETRYSQVHDVAFERDSESPFAVATLRYDDRAGVLAMAARQGRSGASPYSVPLGGGWISVSVRDDRGSPLEALRVGDQTYVVGRAGERYSIVLRNGTGHRVEAVGTVDGLDVLNGQAGSLANRGYLLEGHATLVIDGFRQSDSAVAAFRFGRVADSYAAQTGSAREVGVIGVAFFSERGDRGVAEERSLEEEARTRETAIPFPADTRYARPPGAR